MRSSKVSTCSNNSSCDLPVGKVVVVRALVVSSKGTLQHLDSSYAITHAACATFKEGNCLLVSMQVKMWHRAISSLLKPLRSSPKTMAILLPLLASTLSRVRDSGSGD